MVTFLRICISCLPYLTLHNSKLEIVRTCPSSRHAWIFPLRASMITCMDVEMHLNYESVAGLVSTPQFTRAGNQSLVSFVACESVMFSNKPAGFQHFTNSYISNKEHYMRHSSVTIAKLTQTIGTWISSTYESLALLFAPGSPFSSIRTLQLSLFHRVDINKPCFPSNYSRV